MIDHGHFTVTFGAAVYLTMTCVDFLCTRLGCQMNVADSERMKGQLEVSNHSSIYMYIDVRVTLKLRNENRILGLMKRRRRRMQVY